MPTFVPPTYDQPLDNELGRHGVAFPVGYVVWIDTDDGVHQATAISQDIINSTNGVTGAATGSGDLGKAIFRNGRTYTVTSEEETLLDDAGYTVT